MSDNFRIENVYVAGNPIDDAKLFFGRETLFQHIHDQLTQEGKNHLILLIGGWRSGKTSFLLQVRDGRLNTDAVPIWVDFMSIADSIHSDQDLACQIGKAIIKKPEFQHFETEFLQQNDSSWNDKLLNLCENVCQQVAPKKLLLLCDEFETLESWFHNSQTEHQSKNLSAQALSWFKRLSQLPVYLLMSGSRLLQNPILQEHLQQYAEKRNIYELKQQDTINLIRKPMRGQLEYSDDAVLMIYRLSGGQPFFTQWVCQYLVSLVNCEFKRREILVDDIPRVIEECLQNPSMHLQKTWEDPVGNEAVGKGVSKAELVNQVRHLLASLAHTNQSEEIVCSQYIGVEQILHTAQQRNFHCQETTIYKTLGWLKQHSRLLEWEEEKYRFRMDLLRHFIKKDVHRGEDIEDSIAETAGSTTQKGVQTSQQAEFIQTLQEALSQDKHIQLNQRQALDQLAQQMGQDWSAIEQLENQTRKQLGFAEVNWVQEYRENCQQLKAQYKTKLPDNRLQALAKTYEAMGRLNKQKTAEIQTLVGFKQTGSAKYWLIAGVIVMLLGFGGIGSMQQFRIWFMQQLNGGSDTPSSGSSKPDNPSRGIFNGGSDQPSSGSSKPDNPSSGSSETDNPSSDGSQTNINPEKLMQDFVEESKKPKEDVEKMDEQQTSEEETQVDINPEKLMQDFVEKSKKP